MPKKVTPSMPLKTAIPSVRRISAPAPKATSSQSYPLSTQGSWRSQPQPPTVSVWQLMWPYALVIFGTMGLALVASLLHRRHAIKTSWMDPKSRESLKGRLDLLELRAVRQVGHSYRA